MDFSSEPHRRKSTRLKDYNYSWPGAYHVTICTDDRRPIFGEISDGELHRSSWGDLAIECWQEIPSKWPPVEVDVYILMPDHFHGVLMLPDTGVRLPSVSIVSNWYKATVTKVIRRMEKDKDIVIWQRNFHDHIVRDDNDLAHIREYLVFNPGRQEEIDEYTRNHELWLARRRSRMMR